MDPDRSLLKGKPWVFIAIGLDKFNLRRICLEIVFPHLR